MHRLWFDYTQIRMNYWQKWKYKNLTLLVLSIFFAFWVTKFGPFHNFLLTIGEWGYVGAFFAGFLFVSTFTVATGFIILLILAESLNVLELAFIAGLGSVLGDLLIFRFVKDGLVKEIIPIYKAFGGNHINHVLNTKYFSWTFSVFGAIIIASPLPDELGVSLLGLSRLKTYQFIIISFALNTIGIILLISASTVIKP